MYADTNVTIPGANFQNIGLKVDIRLRHILMIYSIQNHKNFEEY